MSWQLYGISENVKPGDNDRILMRQRANDPAIIFHMIAGPLQSQYKDKKATGKEF